MRQILVITGAIVALAYAQAPRFQGPYSVYDGVNPIDVSYYAAPVMYDWDGDGNKDLICGEYDGGYIRFYRNIGADSSPEFNGYEYLSASGSQITLPYG
jgi:hypothetical protein